MERKQKGLSIRFLTLILAVVTLAAFGSVLFLLFRLNLRFNLVQNSIDKYLTCQNSSQTIKDSASYLTEQARLFVITHNTRYAESYLNETNVVRKREKAVQELARVCDSDDFAFQRLRIAQTQSENLVSVENYAIRLVYESLKNQQEIPESIKSVNLRDVDKNLSPEELQQLAMNTLFSDGYLIYKQRVDENCNLSVESIEEEISDELKINSNLLGDNLKSLKILLILLFIVVAAIFVSFNFLVLHVLKKFIKAMQKDERLPYEGSSELRFFADTYNSIYEIKAQNEKKLLFNAEYDALTGILNRRAFEQVCEKCQKEKDKIALLLIDMDNFKNINDTYGHSGGDTALKELAKHLTETFRRSDYICRIGGDEFAVILCGIKANANEAIIRKINNINLLLSEIESGIRHVSISAGAALSDEGYSKELYEKADKALYYTKEHGRAGCKIYGKDCENVHVK